MAALEDHPGYLGLTSQGVIAIHADWPIHPEEHGAELALLWLTAFPQDTLFKRIDDIDRCFLFLADVKSSIRSDLFDRRNFHVAIWHEDLLALADSEFVSGVSRVTERQRQDLWRSEVGEQLFIRLEDGSLKPLDLPPLEGYDDEDTSWPEVVREGILVTSAGRGRAASLLSQGFSLAVLGDRVEQLMHIGYFDAAVREACIALEHRMKVWLRSAMWGDALVEEFIARLRDQGIGPESHLRVLRGEIRAAFKFIRNDFMHNFVEIDETQARAILFRLGRVTAVLDRVLSDDA